MIIDSHEHVMIPLETQVSKLRDAHIDKAILFCTLPHPEQATTLAELTQEMKVLSSVLQGNHSAAAALERDKNQIHELKQAINTYPDMFWGFGKVPLGHSVAETQSWITDEVVAQGFKGIGEFTPGSLEQVQQLETVFQALESFAGLPIWVHTFNPVTAEGIAELKRCVQRHPHVPVIFGHLGGSNWMEVIEFAEHNPSVYLDLSGTFSTMAVSMAIKQLPERCLFSSDAPYGEPALSRQMIEYISPSSSIAAKVLGENIATLLAAV